MKCFRIRRVGSTDKFSIDTRAGLLGKYKLGEEEYSFEEALYNAEASVKRENHAYFLDGSRVKLDVRVMLQLNDEDERILCCSNCSHCTYKSKYVQLCDYNGVIGDMSSFCRAFEIKIM